jgi:uncharacterized protein (DUF433 family)
VTAKKKSPNGIVHSDPSILGGTPVFVGTRVPLQNLMDYLDAGQSIDEFLEAFPSVTREQALAVAEIDNEELLKSA